MSDIIGSVSLQGIKQDGGTLHGKIALTDGYDIGYSDGLRVGGAEGYVDGYDDGEIEGYAKGKSEGYTSGKSDGITEGYSNGYSKGQTDGYAAGQTAGYIEGKADGKTEGYNEGYAEGKADAEENFVVKEEVEKTVELDFSEGDMTITAEEGKLYNKIYVNQPASLIPPHIADGVNIAGVVGTLKSSSGEAMKSRAINFYDIYGNIVYSYTRAQAAALTALPKIPEVEGFEAKEWNRTLDEVKSAPAFMDIGPRYTKNGTKALLYVLDVQANDIIDLNFYTFYFSSTEGNCVIHWGDGTSETFSISSSSTITKTHTYINRGTYVACIAYSGTIYAGKNSSISAADASWGTIVARRKGSQVYNDVLLSASGGGMANTSSFAFALRLQYLDFRPYGMSSIDNCPQLLVNTYKNEGNSLSKYEYRSCYSLKRVLGRAGGGTSTYLNFSNYHCVNDYLATSGSGHYLGNAQIRRIIITGTAIGYMEDLNTYCLEGIYVPESVIETYKTHTNWKAGADYIKPLSEYPDY